MALNAKVGSFNTTTGTVGTTIEVNIGFQPKAILFWWNGEVGTSDHVGRANARRGFGFATSPTSRYAVQNSVADNVATTVTSRYHHNASCVVISPPGAAGVEGRLDINSIDADGFTLVVDNDFASNYRIHYLALGGADISNVATGSFQTNIVTGNQAITGVGFQPDFILLLSAGFATSPPVSGGSASFSLGLGTSIGQCLLAGFDLNAAVAASCQSYCNDTEILSGATPTPTAISERASLVSLDADGFTINVLEEVNTNSQVFYLALRGGRYKITTLSSRTDNNNIVVDTLGVGPPAAVLFLSHCRGESSADTGQSTDKWSIGAATGPTERVAMGGLSVHAADPTTVASIVEHDAIYTHINNSGGIDALMDLVSMDSDGFTCVMDDTDSGSNFLLALAIGANAVVTPVINQVSTCIPGQIITIIGDGFGAVQGTGGVTVNGTAQTISSWANGSISVTGVIGTAKYGTNVTLRVTRDGGTFNEVTVQWQPASGVGYINLVSPLVPSANRLTATLDVAGGDQLEYSTVVGGVFSDVILTSNGAFRCLPNITAFTFRVNDGTGWGTNAVQTIQPGIIVEPIFGYNLIRPILKTIRAGFRRAFRIGWNREG